MALFNNPSSVIVALGGSAIGVLAFVVMFLEHRRPENKDDHHRRHRHRH